MSLTYEHVLTNLNSCAYANIVQKIVNKGVDINAKNKNEVVTFNMWKNNCDGVILILFIGLNLLFNFQKINKIVSKIMNLYKFV
jgi:hypothetical protein